MKIMVFLLLLLSPMSLMAEWKGNLYDLVSIYDGKAEDANLQLKAIAEKLDEGVDPNVKEEGTPVIFKALEPDRLKVLELLVKRQADVNSRNKIGSR